MMTSEEEIHGLLFITREDKTIEVLDLNYGSILGTIVLEEGPGWIIRTSSVGFFDWGQLNTLGEYISRLNQTL